MRTSTIALTIAITILVTSGAVWGEDYPWSAETQVNIPNRAAELVDAAVKRRGAKPPAAPQMQRAAIFSSSKKRQDEQQVQGAVDAQNFEFDQVPAPAAADDVYQSVIEQQNPALTVPSNAIVEQPNYCCRDCRRNRCQLGCVKRIFGKSPRGLEMGGWTNFGYHNRPTIIFNDRADEFNVHQVYLYAQKLARRSGRWNLGYRVDAVYGIDAQNTQAFGNRPTGAPDHWDNDWDNGEYGWALPQAYAQLANGCWDVKAGKFYSPFGYESVMAPENFFYSHSYTFGFVQPLTLTGVLAEKRTRRNNGLILGATTGWDTGFNQNQDGFNIITGVNLQPNQNVDLAFRSSYGDTGYRGTGTLNTGIARLRLTENLRYVLQGNFLDLRDNEEFGIVQYLFRDISCCLGLGARLEWWKSDQIFPDTKSTYEFTMGANWRPRANIVFRPELRWDWGAGAPDPGATIFGMDAVVLY